jgi:hypothetical protein
MLEGHARPIDAPAPVAAGPEAVPRADAKTTRTSVSIEVVTEDGNRCSAGELRFKGDPLQMMRRGMSPLKHLHDASLADANPVVLGNLPDDMDGLDVEVLALVPDLTSAVGSFTVRLHQTTAVRIVARQGQSLEVRVFESDGVVPIEGASVVSVTEVERHSIEPSDVRGKVGPGSAATDRDGACLVRELGPGEHRFEIDAADHVRAEVTWSAGPLVVRLERVRGLGTVVVKVFGPDSRPAAGIAVEMMGTDRRVTTGADGVAMFNEVPAGLNFYRFTLPSGPEAAAWIEKVMSGLALMAKVHVDPGGHHVVGLGMQPSAASFEGRIVTEDGTPIAGAEFSVMADLAIFRATSDIEGVVRVPEVPPSEKLLAFVEVGSGAQWVFDDIEMRDGRPLARTWTLGTTVIRGRVVKGVAKTPAFGARLRVSGPLSGLTSTSVDGSFEFSRARVGTYRVEVNPASTGGFGARPVEVEVPAATGLVIELIECGSVAVRFPASERTALRDAKIELSAANGDQYSLRDSKEGDADLVANYVLPGTYQIKVDVAGRVRTFQTDVSSGATAVVEVRVP